MTCGLHWCRLIDIGCGLPTGIIRESLFLKDKPHWKLTRSIFVTDGAKMESPLTVILWANGVEVRSSMASGHLSTC